MELIFAVHLNGPVVCRCFPDLEGDGAGGLDTLDCGVRLLGLPLRKGPAWRSTASERVFICFDYLGSLEVVFLWVCCLWFVCLFGFLPSGGFFSFAFFCICPRTPDQSHLPKVAVFCFKGRSCSSDEKLRKVFGQDPT